MPSDIGYEGNNKTKIPNTSYPMARNINKTMKEIPYA